MDCCNLNLKTGAFLTSLLGTGSLSTGAIMSAATGSIQPLVASTAITVLASVIGLVAGQILRRLGITQDDGTQMFSAILIATGAYIGLTIAAGVATGPGGVLGIAMAIASLAIPVFMFMNYTQLWNSCLS